MLKNLLITDGESRSSLAATRSLGKKGCRVVVTAKQEISLASCSRFCSQGFSTPDPLLDGAKYSKAIIEIVKKEKIDVVFPMSEVSIHLLNEIRNQLPSRVILACSTSDKMAAVSNKSLLFRLASRVQVPIPHTLHLQSAADLSEVIEQINHYPVVIKPAMSRIPKDAGFLFGGVRYAKSREELKNLYATIDVLRYPPMIQERIEGPGTGLFTLYDGNKHLALFSHRRLREKPPSGGVSVFSESAPLDEEMVEYSRRLLSAVGWQGVAMVEFKRDLRDGKAKLMEINGRFWGTLQLAISCGVDFPALYLDFLQGKKPPALVRDYLVGHKMKWFFGTLDYLYIRLKHKNENLNLPPGSPTKWKVIMDFLKIFEKNTSFDVFNRNDIKPFCFEALSYMRRAVKKG